jgi:hypothetical protein
LILSSEKMRPMAEIKRALDQKTSSVCGAYWAEAIKPGAEQFLAVSTQARLQSDEPRLQLQEIRLHGLCRSLRVA